MILRETTTVPNQVSYTLTGEFLTPAVIRTETGETPVWMQQRWQEGEFAVYVRKNGCGHCCTAMAARLHGVAMDPYTEYEHCRRLWGEPGPQQGHWLSTAGIVKVLHSLNVPAEGFGVESMGPEQAVAQILAALRAGKQVIFTSNPDHYPDNPFSNGYHWVMAVALQADGTVLIANSSDKAVTDGIQTVTPDIIERALFREATAPEDMTWGEEARIHVGSGFIVVG